MKAIYQGCACGESRPHIKCQDDRVNKAIAVFYNKRTGKRTAIMPTVYGGIYEYRLDYNGMFAWGATADFGKIAATITTDLQKQGDIIWQKTPRSNYHIWHICYCEECNGKIWTHSQSDWNSHLKYVDNENVFTFPSVN